MELEKHRHLVCRPCPAPLAHSVVPLVLSRSRVRAAEVLSRRWLCLRRRCCLRRHPRLSGRSSEALGHTARQHACEQQGGERQGARLHGAATDMAVASCRTTIAVGIVTRHRSYRVRRSCGDRRGRAWRAEFRGRPRGRLGGGTAVFSVALGVSNSCSELKRTKVLSTPSTRRTFSLPCLINVQIEVSPKPDNLQASQTVTVIGSCFASSGCMSATAAIVQDKSQIFTHPTARRRFRQKYFRRPLFCG